MAPVVRFPLKINKWMENTLNAINIYFFKPFNIYYVNPDIGLY